VNIEAFDGQDAVREARTCEGWYEIRMKPREETRSSKLLALAACAIPLVAVVACGSTTAALDAGVEDGGVSDTGSVDAVAASEASTLDAADADGAFVPKSRAIVRMNGGAAADCATVPAMAIGDFGDVAMGIAPTPVENGDRLAGKVVTIQCRVARDGSGYALEGNVAVDGDVTLALRGALDNAGKGNVTAFSLKKTVGWTSTSCTLDTTVRPGAGAAAGRIWAMVSCGGARSEAGGTCDIFGEIRLENCAQL
jgi:hypothetical protein